MYEKDVSIKPITDSPEVNLQQTIQYRLMKRLSESKAFDVLNDLGIKTAIVGGGALLRQELKDFDIWPMLGQEKPFLDYFRKQDLPHDVPATLKTPTGAKIQLCQGPIMPLEDLIKNFDFAHCQIGALISDSKLGWFVDRVAYTQDFKAAMAAQTTWYCGNAQWPLHSLVRIPRQASKLGLNDEETTHLTYQVVADLLSRELTESDKEYLDKIRKMAGSTKTL